MKATVEINTGSDAPSIVNKDSSDSLPIRIPGTDLEIVYDIPHLKVDNKLWYDPSLLDHEELKSSLRMGHPKQSKNPTVIFLLGPKACGKTTFMTMKKEYLQNQLMLDPCHCLVDYEYLRNSHRGYNALQEHAKKNNQVYVLASKKLKGQFKNWKVQTAYTYANERLDLVVTDNRGKKLKSIVDRMSGYSVHVVFMFISFETCLERQRKRAYEEGRSIKPMKYCKLMKKLAKTFGEAEGSIVIVDNENFQCDIKGIFDQNSIDEAMRVVLALHENYNKFPFELFAEENFSTIRDKHIPHKFKPFSCL